MRKVLKYEIDPGNQLDITLPADAFVVLVAEQYGKLTLWFDTAMEGKARTFEVFATGQEIPEGYIHRGSAVCAGGYLIWHVYEVPHA
jgi:hypothetical protein